MIADATSLFDDALRYRQIANELHLFIGLNIECTCVNTPEYDEFLERSNEAKSRLETTEEKLLFEIFNVFDGNPILHECDRCAIMFKYEKLIGEDAMDVEFIKRIKDHGGDA